MTSRNIIEKYGNIADQSKIFKPPQGCASDSFYLGNRQQAQVKQQNVEISDEASVKGSTSSFAGITESTRVRKPPGGDTNDIFGMEDRQRLQAHVQKFLENDVLNNTRTWKRSIDISTDQEEKCEKNSSDFSYLLNQLNVSMPIQTPSYQLDKENLNILPDKADQIDRKITNQFPENNLKAVDEEVEEESKCSTKRYLRRNPITGEVIEVEVTFRSKLADCSNFVPTQDRAQMTKGFETHRTSVRVRQPPGGASSNIF
ncbi:hypothetical protein AVEN_199648-1 [Araneus ventricosus]|uniref:Uncharacterized protein n=1 Tax=Araneus ventricosus TaxID=182803 RepID=A0A4Y2DFC9_ARAVE|nr:hypothetical protein AVEN_199648-1 [Araneus ventricosus]